MRHKRCETSLLNDVVVLLLSIIVVGTFFVNLAIYYIQKNPIEALEVIIGFMLVIWFIVVGIKKILGYLGQGAGNWIIEVIREIKGTSATARTAKRYEANPTKFYDADPIQVNDAIDCLVKFGMKRNEASLKVHSAVVGIPISDVDSVEKIVKKALAVN